MPRAYTRKSLPDRCVIRARQIYANLQIKGSLQVRFYQGLLLTYRFPVPSGYGLHGQLIAVYSPGAALEWIEEDLLTFAHSVSDTETPVCA